MLPGSFVCVCVYTRVSERRSCIAVKWFDLGQADVFVNYDGLDCREALTSAFADGVKKLVPPPPHFLLKASAVTSECKTGAATSVCAFWALCSECLRAGCCDECVCVHVGILVT